MDDKVQVLAEVCQALAVGDSDGARTTLNTRYPFVPITSNRTSFSKRRLMQVFFRDKFTDRYTGRRLVFPGTLLLISRYLPMDFPVHPNWRTSETHFAYYELWPTLDHVQPVTRGGSNDDENLVTTSMIRNTAKANFTLDELRWKLFPASHNADWDGLTKWFLATIESDPSIIEDNAIRGWHKAASAV